MTLKFRTFQHDDDITKIQNVHARWIAEAGDHSTIHIGDIPHRIYNGLRGRYPLVSCIGLWEDGNDLMAWALVYPHWLTFDCALAPDLIGTAIERDIYQWAEDTTLAWSKRVQTKYHEPGLDVSVSDEARIKVLLAMGYHDKGHKYNYTERNLADAIPEPELPQGFVARSATLEDVAQLCAVHSGAFDSNWSIMQYSYVMHSPGYDVEKELVIVAPDGQFVAFTVTWHDTLNGVGLFEPVGVHEDFHRRGLGKAIMYYGLRRMREAGLKTAVVTHGLNNPAAAALYKSVGFRPKYHIHEYVRALPD